MPITCVCCADVGRWDMLRAYVEYSPEFWSPDLSMYVDMYLRGIWRGGRHQGVAQPTATDEVLKVLSCEDRDPCNANVAWSTKHVMMLSERAAEPAVFEIQVFSITTWRCVFSHTTSTPAQPVPSDLCFTEAFVWPAAGLRVPAPQCNTAILLHHLAGTWAVCEIALGSIASLRPVPVNAEIPAAQPSDQADFFVQGEEVQHPLCSAVGALVRVRPHPAGFSEDVDFRVTLRCGNQSVSSQRLPHFHGQRIESRCLRLEGEVRWARDGIGLTFQDYETMIRVRMAG